MRLGNRTTGMSVAVDRGGDVVLTMSRLRADQLAALIDGAGGQPKSWGPDLVRLLLTAVDRTESESHVSRMFGSRSKHDTRPPTRPAQVASPKIALAGSVAPPIRATHDAEWLQQQIDLASLVREAAADAAAVAQEAVEAAADHAAVAALTARAARSAAVERTADAVAARVARAAAAVESEADAAALTVAQAAFDAALLIASTVAPGSERDAALTATLVATSVSAIAIKTAAVTAAARADVARESAAAATAAAVAAADAAIMVNLEVSCAAEAVRAVALATAATLAEHTAARATAMAMTHR